MYNSESENVEIKSCSDQTQWNGLRERYIEIVKKSLLDHMLSDIVGYEIQPVHIHYYQNKFKKLYKNKLLKLLNYFGFSLVRKIPIVSIPEEERIPSFYSLTLIGKLGLDNIEYCIGKIIEDNIPGDCIETGVWKGGASIFMTCSLRAYGDLNRVVWVADSFEGLPPPDTSHYPQDEGDIGHEIESLVVSLEEVKHHFSCYGVLDDRVRFLKGWFKDTLPQAPIDKLSLMRLDGDMYESTMVALENLYPKLSKGGFVIIDDYALERCKAAVDDYRHKQGISDPIVRVNDSIVYWRRI
jgi:hypothetical protein